jgi:hypothetical protein
VKELGLMSAGVCRGRCAFRGCARCGVTAIGGVHRACRCGRVVPRQPDGRKGEPRSTTGHLKICFLDQRFVSGNGGIAKLIGPLCC